MKNKKMTPIHPGEVLMEDFMKPLAISQNQIARDLRVPPRRINEIVLRKHRVTADTALRLAQYFKTSPQFWMNLQSSYDLDIEMDEVGRKISREVHACSGGVVFVDSLRVFLPPVLSCFNLS